MDTSRLQRGARTHSLLILPLREAFVLRPSIRTSSRLRSVILVTKTYGHDIFFPCFYVFSFTRNTFISVKTHRVSTQKAPCFRMGPCLLNLRIRIAADYADEENYSTNLTMYSTAARNVSSSAVVAPRGGMAPLPLIVTSIIESMPRSIRGAQAALSPSLGALATPVA